MVKSHSRWFGARGAFPLKDRDAGPLQDHWQRREAEPDSASSSFRWECLGPFDVAGRTTSLIVHPEHHDLLFAGSANGGVWRSKNGGGDWEWKWKQWAATAIGCLAFDPHDHNTIYAGTGEANGSVDAYPGCGVYVTHDLGETWTLLAPAENFGLPLRIGALVLHPVNAGEIWLGGVSHEESMQGGLFYSTDSGATWTREDFFSRKPYSCHSIAFHPDGSAFVAIESGGAQSGLWRRSQGIWTRLGGDLPPGDRLSRITVVVAPKEPHPVYCMIASPSGAHLAGVYRSVSPFTAWNSLPCPDLAAEAYFGYNNCLAVHPDNPDILFAGATNVHVTRDAGATWTTLTTWNPTSAPNYVHADQHAIVIPEDGLIYTANDGGVAHSSGNFAAWEMRVHNMCTTMFYDMDVCHQNLNIFGGGAQDNGCLLCTGTGEYARPLGGDGSAVVFDPQREGHAYAARTGIHLVRHTAPKHWTAQFWREASPQMDDSERKQNPFTIAAIDPSDPDTLWTGSWRMWRSTDGGVKWQPKSQFFDGSGVTAIEVAGQIVYAGTAKGGIYRSLNGGEIWGGDISGPDIPARFVTRIETHPMDPRRVVVALGGTDLSSTLAQAPGVKGGPYLSTSTESICHLFYSEDAGTTWKGIGDGLPDVAFHAIAYEGQPPYTLYVANDCGIWATADLKEWTDITGNLPNVMVSDLVYHHATRMLFAATYGRGLWRMPLLA